MRVLDNGIAVIETDQYACKWISETGKLCYDERVETVMKPLIPEGGVVIDCGAYVGGYTGKFLEYVGPTGKVYAFEPNTTAYECLQHNCPTAIASNMPLGSGLEIGRMEIDDTNCGQTHFVTRPKTESDLVPVGSIDGLGAFLPRLDFIKLDVEGMEPNVILGARMTLDAHKPVIFCEINKMALGRAGWSVSTLLELMNLFEYRLLFLHPAHHLGMPLVDVLFVPKDDTREMPVSKIESR